MVDGVENGFVRIAFSKIGISLKKLKICNLER